MHPRLILLIRITIAATWFATKWLLSDRSSPSADSAKRSKYYKNVAWLRWKGLHSAKETTRLSYPHIKTQIKHKFHISIMFFQWFSTTSGLTDALWVTSSNRDLFLCRWLMVPDWRISSTNCFAWFTHFYYYLHNSSGWKCASISFFFWQFSGIFCLEFVEHFGGNLTKFILVSTLHKIILK